jgi:putative zinc finger/helix-turn-helix YgiT family protein
MPRGALMQNTIDKAGCPICGKGQLHEEVGDFKAEFQHESGEPRFVAVPNVKRFRCDACGEAILEKGSEDRISDAQRAAMGRLTAGELERFRKGLELSQEEMADLIGAGRKTYCRWESADHFQSEAFDRFIRLLMFAPSNVDALKLIRREKGVEESDANLAARFPHVKDVTSAKTSSKRFSATLLAGAFRAD